MLHISHWGNLCLSLQAEISAIFKLIHGKSCSWVVVNDLLMIPNNHNAHWEQYLVQVWLGLPNAGATMRILIVESNAALGSIWLRHMRRQGHDVTLAEDQQMAEAALSVGGFDVIVLDVVLARGSSFAVADLASQLQPDIKIVFVTSTSFFSDGSIFSLTANARAFLQSDTPPEDLTAVVEHFGKAS